MNITDNVTYVSEWIEVHHTGLLGFIESHGWVLPLAFVFLLALLTMILFWPHKQTLAERISEEEARK